jgi:hypothetical protein
MCSTASIAHIASPLLGVPAVLYGALPTWALVVLLGVTTTLTAAQVAVTQVIRLRASNRITRSNDNLRVLEIQDSPRHRQAPPRLAPARKRSTKRPAAQ